MDIVVCIKWVPNTTSVNIDQKTGTLIRTGVPSLINPHDLHALEMALALKDQFGGSVTVLTMAPPTARLGLEHAVGMGCDRAVLVTDMAYAGADTLATSYTLAKAIGRLRFDLILVGQETVDSSTAHIGAQIASWLHLPYLYYVVDARYLGDSRIWAKRMLEDTYEEYKLPLPALLAAAMHSTKPRRVRLSYKMRCRDEGIVETWSNKTLGLDASCVGLKGSPTIVRKTSFVPEVPRKKIVCQPKDLDQAAEWLIKKLVEDRLLKI
jgi:electron transfer flavoprotein beta subunit